MKTPLRPLCGLQHSKTILRQSSKSLITHDCLPRSAVRAPAPASSFSHRRALGAGPIPATQRSLPKTVSTNAARRCTRRSSQQHAYPARAAPRPSNVPLTVRTFSTTSCRNLSATPTDPPPSDPVKEPLTPREYHTLADAYLETLVEAIEEQVFQTNKDADVEYSAGVMTITFPPAGTYVLNKQPPNRQIWLSSPISGPKRYDWVTEGTNGAGKWLYKRDGSALTELLEAELGFDGACLRCLETKGL